MPPFFSLVCGTLRTAFPTENGGLIFRDGGSKPPPYTNRNKRTNEKGDMYEIKRGNRNCGFSEKGKQV